MQCVGFIILCLSTSPLSTQSAHFFLLFVIYNNLLPIEFNTLSVQFVTRPRSSRFNPPPPTPQHLPLSSKHHARGSKPESESNGLSARDLGVWGEGESSPRDQHIWILLGVKASPCLGACAARPN